MIFFKILSPSQTERTLKPAFLQDMNAQLDENHFTPLFNFDRLRKEVQSHELFCVVMLYNLPMQDQRKMHLKSINLSWIMLSQGLSWEFEKAGANTSKSSKFNGATQHYVVKLPKSASARHYCPKIPQVPGNLGTRANSSPA